MTLYEHKSKLFFVNQSILFCSMNHLARHLIASASRQRPNKSVELKKTHRVKKFTEIPMSLQ